MQWRQSLKLRQGQQLALTPDLQQVVLENPLLEYAQEYDTENELAVVHEGVFPQGTT